MTMISFLFTVSVNVLCFHVTYGRGSQGACQLLLLATTSYGYSKNKTTEMSKYAL